MAKRQGEPKNIAQTVHDAIKTDVNAAGFELWDVEYVKEGSEWYLRITIDREKGVDMSACEEVMGIVDPIVTRLDPIEGAYHLEVSSPGLERSLRTDAHYLACIGKEIRVKLFSAEDGRKEWTGTLISFSDGVVSLQTDAGERKIEKKRISKANVVFDFDALGGALDESDVPEEIAQEDGVDDGQ